MMEHIRKGKGVKSPYGDHLWLDISILGRAHVEKIFVMCKIFAKLSMVLILLMKVQKVGLQFYLCSIILWVALEQNLQASQWLDGLFACSGQRVGICTDLTAWEEIAVLKPLLQV